MTVSCHQMRFYYYLFIKKLRSVHDVHTREREHYKEKKHSDKLFKSCCFMQIYAGSFTNSTIKVLPLAGAETTSMVPLKSSIILLVMYKPIPLPLMFLSLFTL